MTRRPNAGFTPAEAARRWHCSSELVAEFLQDFAEARLVERVGRDLWRVTPQGLELAFVVARLDDREQVA